LAVGGIYFSVRKGKAGFTTLNSEKKKKKNLKGNYKAGLKKGTAVDYKNC